MTLQSLLYLIVYVVLFLIVFTAVVWWDRRRRRTRPPFPENLKLLRMPGQHLLYQVTHSDENGFLWLAGAILAPLLIGTSVLHFLAHFFPSRPALVIILSLTSFVLLILLAARFFDKYLQRRDDNYLGFFGERYVAERLEPLKTHGWSIFHDIPFAGATGPFNLDHVAVGPGGIWVIETKTRRKGAAKPGRQSHEVKFDGQQIIWPAFEETASLKQALDNARSLQTWLRDMTGKTFEIASVVAIPGYMVIENKLGPVRLANPMNLPDVLTSRPKSKLSPTDIDLIRRQLESKCRTFEY